MPDDRLILFEFIRHEYEADPVGFKKSWHDPHIRRLMVRRWRSKVDDSLLQLLIAEETGELIGHAVQVGRQIEAELNGSRYGGNPIYIESISPDDVDTGQNTFTLKVYGKVAGLEVLFSRDDLDGSGGSVAVCADVKDVEKLRTGGFEVTVEATLDEATTWDVTARLPDGSKDILPGEVITTEA